MRVVKPLLLACAMFACAKDSGSKAPAAEPKTKTATSAASPQASLSDQPESCQGCHPAIYAEWRETMHAKAHHSRDPIYAAVRQLRIEKEGEAITRVCGQCHTPRSAALPDTDAARTGVSCATCHNLRRVRESDDQFGAVLLQWALPGVFLGPHNLAKEKIDAHGLGYAPDHMKDGAKLCLACHGQLANANEVALCTTGNEWKAAKGDQTCVDCHMPLADGPGTIESKPDYHRSHRFVGPRAGWENREWAPYERGVKLEAALSGGRLSVTLVNASSHAYPSGFPGRMLLVKAVGFDGNGTQVWTNFAGDPMQESPEAVLNKVYVDADGQPTLAAFAARLARDTRLKPDERRALRFEVPASVERVEVRLLLRLMPPPLAKTLGLEGGPLDGAQPIAKLEVTRGKKG